MMSGSKLRFREDGGGHNDETEPNEIRNVNSDDEDDNDYAGALDQTRTQQRKHRPSIHFSPVSQINSTIVTQHKGDLSRSKSKGSNRKQSMFHVPPLRSKSKHFTNEMDYLQEAARIHTDDEILIQPYAFKPFPPSRDLYFNQNERMTRRDEDKKGEDDDLDGHSRRLNERTQDMRRLHQTVGRQVIGSTANDVRKVHVSEIMKQFKCKDDFIKILSIEGQYYLPPTLECNIEYLTGICSGQKKVSAI